MSPELRERVAERASRLGLSVSAYIQTLIRKDLSRGGPLTLGETPDPASHFQAIPAGPTLRHTDQSVRSVVDNVPYGEQTSTRKEPNSG